MAEYRATLAAEGRSLTVDDGAALAIGQWSIESGLMGRGARAALEKLLRDPLFTGEPKDIVLTREGVVQVLGTPNGR
jgi:ATP-dependent protease Clp ATPase subunit